MRNTRHLVAILAVLPVVAIAIVLALTQGAFDQIQSRSNPAVPQFTLPDE